MDMENSCGLMAARTMENSTKIIYKEKASIAGQTEESTKDSGSTTKWKVTVFSPGVTAECTWASTRMTKKIARAPSSGQMVGNT